MKPVFKCVITHDIKKTTVKTLLELICYLRHFEGVHRLTMGSIYPFEEDIFSGKNTIVRVVNSDYDEQKFIKAEEELLAKDIDCTTSNIEENLIAAGATIFSLDSDELPLIEVFNILIHEKSNFDMSIAVPMIHMKYKEKSLEIDNKEFKFKKFLDQENIFYETTSDIEIRLREIPKYTMPKIPLSSKWVDWPKTKTIFKTNNTTTQVFGDMKLAVYKFERIVEE